MSQQNQSQSFTLRIAGTETSRLAEGNNSCSSSPIDLMAAYRTSRIAAHQSLASMRGLGSTARFSGGASYYRKAG